MPVKSFSNEAN